MSAFEKLKKLLTQDITDTSALKAVIQGDDSHIQSRLDTAIRAGDVAAAQAALALGANPWAVAADGCHALQAAIRQGHEACVAWALALPNARDHLDEPDAHGYPPVVWAAAQGYVAMVQALLAAGADIQRRGPRQQTALHRAATLDNPRLLKVLHDAGADWETVDAAGQTPLDVLAQHRPQALNSWRRRAQERQPGQGQSSGSATTKDNIGP